MCGDVRNDFVKDNPNLEERFSRWRGTRVLVITYDLEVMPPMIWQMILGGSDLPRRTCWTCTTTSWIGFGTTCTSVCASLQSLGLWSWDGWDATQVACQRLSTIGYFTTNYRFSGFPVAFTLEPIHWYGWWSHHWFPSLRIPVVLLVCWFMNTYIYGIIVTVLLSRYSSMIPLINPGCPGWWIHSPRSHKG